jgi:IS5 family transposase
MLRKHQDACQLDLFKSNLKQIINLKHPLVILADLIPWETLEKQFENLYSHRGAPSHTLRKMIGLLILQRIYNLSDERTTALWTENLYWQYFCGEHFFQHSQPCAASDMTHFRQRLTPEGIKAIFALSVQMHEKTIAKAKEIVVDTTAQEANITYPTDAKLYKKVIDKCNKIAQKVGIKLRQSYKFITQKLTYQQRYYKIKNHVKKAVKATKKLKTLAGRQIRDLQRKLKDIGKTKIYDPVVAIMQRIVEQTKNTKNKIYSLSSPEVSCIAKGKVGKKYEYGSKVSIASLPGSTIVLGAFSFSGNPHDSKTLEPTLNTIKELTGKQFDRVIVDRGYRGKRKVSNTDVILPGKCKNRTKYEQRKHKLKCRLRSSIEATIGHLKSDHRMGRNYLKGSVGAEMNALLAGIGINFKLLLQ